MYILSIIILNVNRLNALIKTYRKAERIEKDNMEVTKYIWFFQR